MAKINFKAISKNERNMSGMGRDKSKDIMVVLGIASGKVGMTKVGADKPAIVEAADIQTTSLTMLGAFLKGIASKQGAPVTIFAPHDTVIRAKAIFGALKRGDNEYLTEKAVEYIGKYRDEESTAAYINAVNGLASAIIEARESKRLVVVRELDDLSFTVIDGVSGIDVNNTFVLSGQTVEFNADNIAMVPKGTAVGKDSAMTLAKDTYLHAAMTQGKHVLSVRNIYGDRKNRKLVALVDDEKKPELKRARDAYFALLATMNPKTEESADIAFDAVANEDEIPA